MTEQGVSNDFSGSAQSVLQAGSVGTVVFTHGADRVPVPQQLPMAATNFVNQTALLAQLDGAREDDSPSLYCVVGQPGVGKTAAVVHWAYRNKEHFHDGVLFADLRGFHPTGTPAEPGEVLDGFLAALGVASAFAGSPLDGRAAAYRSATADRRMLVVLDNAADATQVRPLVPGGTTTVLVTSRTRLRGLAIKEGAVVLDTVPLPAAEAVQLLSRISGAGTDREVQELAKRCGYLPLALRIAGQRMASGYYTRVADLLDELSHEADVLDVLDSDDETTALRAVFSVSYRHLTVEQSTTFRLLGVAPGVTIGSDAAAALVGTRKTLARRALDGLHQANLIEQVAPDRYRMHDLLRIFAIERAEAEEDADARRQALRRVLAWYLSTALNADAALDARHPGTPASPGGGAEFANTPDAMAWFRAEQPNLVACVRQAAGIGEHATAWRIAAALFEYFYRQKAWDDWFATHILGVASAKAAGEPFGVASLLGRLAVAHREKKEYAEAENRFREALSIWTDLGNDEGQAWIAGRYAQTYREQGRLDEAVQLCQQALAASERSGARQEAGIVHNNLSGTHRDAGRLDEALAHAEAAIAAFDETGYQRGRAWARHNAANVHRDAGRFTDAIELYEQVLHERRDFGDDYGAALTTRELGHALCASGDLAAGIARLRECLELFSPDDANADIARTLLAEYQSANDE